RRISSASSASLAGVSMGARRRSALPLPTSSSAHGNRPPFEGENLARIEKPARIERALHRHLDGEVLPVELKPHEVALFNANAVLAGQAAANVDAQLQDISPGLLGGGELGGVVRIIENERMQVAIAGVKDIGDLHAVTCANLGDLGEHLG